MRAGAKMLMISSRGGSGGQNEMRSGGQNEMRNEMRSGGEMRNEMRYEGGSGGRNEMRYEGGSGGRNEMRNGGEMRYEGGSGGRNEMRYEGGSGGQNEMRNGGEMRGGYGDMRNEMESRFRDRRGREHYDNGRFAPRNEMEEMRGGQMRNEMRGAQNEMRAGYGDMRNEMRGEMRNDYMRANEMRGEMRGEMRSEGGQSRYPFGPVPPIYEGGGEMNRIGFVVPIGRSEVGGDFRSDASYSEMGQQGGMPMMGGASGETMMLTEEMAHEWMQGLQNEDGTKGPHWSKEQIKQVMTQKGAKQEPIEFWAIMNTLYADYCSVLKKHGVNTIDFYVDLTNAWLKDKDAQKGKAARYFQYIVK